MTRPPLYLFNSMTRQKERFTPLHPGYVGMYVCGPTVSGESHLGHARPFITFDVLFRLLQHLSYKVRYVRNITDAGHFEEEGRASEDKISAKAFLEQLAPMELVQKYTHLFHRAMSAFNCLPPSIEPTATGHITEQISMIRQLLNKGYAYEAAGSVYFDVTQYSARYPYGTLSGRKIEELRTHTRDLSGQEEKRHPADFALWKKAPPQHIMRWESPWGEGFPGWHIECSAMSYKYLGQEFDIHGGGMDLQFPHHESEIAQSHIHNGCLPARYWLHNNMITINGKKMGKSYNNVIKLSELFAGAHPLLAQPYTPATVRFFILQTHYRSTLDFSNEALQAAEKGLKKLSDAYQFIQNISDETLHTIPDTAPDQALREKLTRHLTSMTSDICDDLNTAKTLAHIFEIVPTLNALKDKHLPFNAVGSALLQQIKQQLFVFIETILGLALRSRSEESRLDAVIQILIRLRREARLRQDFTTSDQIRDQLQSIGIQLKDGKDGSCIWE